MLFYKNQALYFKILFLGEKNSSENMIKCVSDEWQERDEQIPEPDFIGRLH